MNDITDLENLPQIQNLSIAEASNNYWHDRQDKQSFSAGSHGKYGRKKGSWTRTSKKYWFED